MGRSASNDKTDSFQWTDNEVHLLLSVAIDYKSQRAMENVNWESVQSKYTDIKDRFKDKLPETGERQADEKDLPHTRDEIKLSCLTGKLKAIHLKCRQAVDSGRRSGHGRAVLLFFELCERLWGGLHT